MAILTCTSNVPIEEVIAFSRWLSDKQISAK
jgi:hypothetical protein